MVTVPVNEIVTNYCTEIVGEPDEARMMDYIQQLESRLAVVTPVEKSVKKRLEIEIAVHKLQASFRHQHRYKDPTWLDVSIMRLTTTQLVDAKRRKTWLVPRFALVEVFHVSASCNLEYPSHISLYAPFGEVVDLEALIGDMSAWERFGGERRSITYQFDAPLPDTIRHKAQLAKELGFKVYLICDAQDQWNCDYVPADPLLVATIHDKWVFLDLFDPVGLEEWAAGEMTTPLPVM